MQRKHKAYAIIIILMLSVAYVIWRGVPLFTALAFTSFLSFVIIENKHHLKNLFKANFLIVRNILILMALISVTLPLLMASGALPSLIYYMSEWMIGHNLLIMAFLISLLLSLLLGTAIGTLTILVPLFASIAHQAGLDYAVIVGALISGAYFGDRTSPLSSGLHLIASVTQTDFRKNILLLLKSSIVPFAFACVAFFYLGRNMRVSADMLSENALIFSVFNVTLWRLLPLAIMIVLLLLKIPITRVMGLVFLTSLTMVLVDGIQTDSLFQWLIRGYTIDHPSLTNILRTSGFSQMTNVLWVILFSAILNSIMEADNLMKFIIEPFIKNIKNQRQLYRNAGVLSLILSMVTCSQAMTAMITGKYLSPYFESSKISKTHLAVVIGNVGLNVVALIPWNVNGLMVSQLTQVPTLTYLPYSFFLWGLSLYTLIKPMTFKAS